MALGLHWVALCYIGTQSVTTASDQGAYSFNMTDGDKCSLRSIPDRAQRDSLRAEEETGAEPLRGLETVGEVGSWAARRGAAGSREPEALAPSSPQCELVGVLCPVSGAVPSRCPSCSDAEILQVTCS